MIWCYVRRNTYSSSVGLKLEYSYNFYLFFFRMCQYNGGIGHRTMLITLFTFLWEFPDSGHRRHIFNCTFVSLIIIYPAELTRLFCTGTERFHSNRGSLSMRNIMNNRTSAVVVQRLVDYLSFINCTNKRNIVLVPIVRQSGHRWNILAEQ